MFRAYLRLACFAIGLLIGVQVPGLIDQYGKRVDAHRLEAEKNFAGFRLIAEQMFHGDISALIDHHRHSADAVFMREAETIEENYTRLQMLTRESQAMQGSLIKRIVHVAFKADPQLLRETRDAYSYTVPLTAAAILCGVIVALLASLLVESMLMGVMGLLRSTLPRRSAPASSDGAPAALPASAAVRVGCVNGGQVRAVDRANGTFDGRMLAGASDAEPG